MHIKITQVTSHNQHLSNAHITKFCVSQKKINFKPSGNVTHESCYMVMLLWGDDYCL